MKRITEGILAAALLVFGGHTASAGVIAFDDAYGANGDGSDPNTYYVPQGVIINGAYFGLVGGTGNGDPGNWDLGGTNGSAFLGCNEGDSCTPTFSFASPVGSIALDIGMGFGSSATFTVSSYLNNVLVSSQTLAFTDSALSGGTWNTFSLSGSANKVAISSAGAGAYGIDNFVFSSGQAPAQTPEPATWMAAFAGLGLVAAGRYRNRKAA